MCDEKSNFKLIITETIIFFILITILCLVIIDHSNRISSLELEKNISNDSYSDTDWLVYIEERTKLDNWELWDHGSTVYFNYDASFLEMEFWADGYAIVTVGDGIVVDEVFDYCKIVNTSVYNISVRVGSGYYMGLDVVYNDTVNVKLYRDPDPFYGYIYDKPFEWNMELKA